MAEAPTYNVIKVQMGWAVAQHSTGTVISVHTWKHQAELVVLHLRMMYHKGYDKGYDEGAGDADVRWAGDQCTGTSDG